VGENMRILQIHAKKFSFRTVSEALQKKDETPIHELSKENVLVAFISVERGDDEKVIENATESIAEHAKKVNANSIIIYPYAHLSSNLEKPDQSIKILDELSERLKDKKLEVARAPFGWYKEFELSSFGHPLAELSREFSSAVSLQIKLSKNSYDKLVNDYLKRFGFEVYSNGFNIKEPWDSLVKEFCMLKAENEFYETLNGVTLKEGSRSFFKAKILPGNNEIFDCTMDIDFSIIRNNIKNLKLENEEGIAFYRSENVDSIPVATIINNRYFPFFNGSLFSLILDRLIELEEKKALSPYLPMLFSPYQSVILKVGNVNEEKIIEVKRLLESIGLKRVYLDLSNEKIGSKLRKWGMKWVPLVFIYGEREEETNTIILRERKTNVQYTISLSELEGAVKKFLETQ
jgi:hypothetical protein